VKNTLTLIIWPIDVILQKEICHVRFSQKNLATVKDASQIQPAIDQVCIWLPYFVIFCHIAPIFRGDKTPKTTDVAGGRGVPVLHYDLDFTGCKKSVNNLF